MSATQQQRIGLIENGCRHTGTKFCCRAPLLLIIFFGEMRLTRGSRPFNKVSDIRKPLLWADNLYVRSLESLPLRQSNLMIESNGF
jgi:hypothetical protein